ncbi:hypothetical protein AALP_AA2G040400 [Arabis alpina]|uniref:Uncharacterized protein n=1 Tax=Arabis alpina TaxID=50452 RepID=A0A087HF81_ARAAL|nr:hypothetical protein AALP_AA2G040400 [Arabis alpina]
MMDAKPVPTPLPASPKLTIHAGTVLADGSQYRNKKVSLDLLRKLNIAVANTASELADALTKPLSRTSFQAACSKIGVTRVPPS